VVATPPASHSVHRTPRPLTTSHLTVELPNKRFKGRGLAQARQQAGNEAAHIDDFEAAVGGTHRACAAATPARVSRRHAEARSHRRQDVQRSADEATTTAHTVAKQHTHIQTTRVRWAKDGRQRNGSVQARGTHS
jgi:hypothetical protein